MYSIKQIIKEFYKDKLKFSCIGVCVYTHTYIEPLFSELLFCKFFDCVNFSLQLRIFWDFICKTTSKQRDTFPNYFLTHFMKISVLELVNIKWQYVLKTKF